MDQRDKRSPLKILIGSIEEVLGTFEGINLFECVERNPSIKRYGWAMSVPLKPGEERILKRMFDDLEICCVPVVFGDSPGSPSDSLANASATLIHTGDKIFAITCKHVIDGFRKTQTEDKERIFKIGNCSINPIEHLIDENKALDLASILLADSMNSTAWGGIDCRYPGLPATKIDSEDLVGFAGFPQGWRDIEERDVSGGAWLTAASPVVSTGNGYFYTQIDLDNCEEVLRGSVGLERVRDENRELRVGGMSGGPVLAHRGQSTELAGFIIEYQSSLDLLYVRSADVLTADGRFLDPQI